MNNVITLDDYISFDFVGLALCLNCQHRWLTGINKGNSLISLECPECADENSYVSILPSEYLEAHKAGE